MLLKCRRGTIQLQDKPFAKGGEGGIYDVVGRRNVVAKLYHEAGRTGEKEKKILAMLSIPPDKNTAAQTAWPIDILYTSDNRFVGFLMPRIENVMKIDALYSYDKRNEFPYSFYVRVALNLCAAVRSVHKCGHIIGDLNGANICVDPSTALVTLVDTDSYHIYDAQKTLYRCSVCRGEYVPWEIHKLMAEKENLRTTSKPTFTIQTDLFALAVHIFALLMNGTHPYACIPKNGESGLTFTIDRNIRDGIFAFLPAEADKVAPPIYAPPMGALPTYINTLFILTFYSKRFNEPHNRAKVSDWERALSKFEGELRQCKANPNHQYHRKQKRCPLCTCEEKMRIVLSGEHVETSTPAPKREKQIRKKRRAHITLSRIFDSIGVPLGAVLGFIIWAGIQVLCFWALGFLPLDTVWWGIARYLLVGVCAYIPLWIYAGLDYIFVFSASNIGEGIGNALNVSRFFAYVVFGAIGIISSWGDLLSMALNAAGAILPAFLIHRLLPGATSDLID